MGGRHHEQTLTSWPPGASSFSGETVIKEQRNKITKNPCSRFQAFGGDSKPRCDVVYYPIKKKKKTDLSSFLPPVTTPTVPSTAMGLCQQAKRGEEQPVPVGRTPSSHFPPQPRCKVDIVSPTLQARSSDSWLRAEVTWHLLWGFAAGPGRV